MSLLAQRNAPLRLAFREGEATISAQTPDVGEASETLPVPFSRALRDRFNPEFLKDGVEKRRSDDLVLKLISPLRRTDRGRRRQWLPYLIMPIRLNVKAGSAVRVTRMRLRDFRGYAGPPTWRSARA